MALEVNLGLVASKALSLKVEPTGLVKVFHGDRHVKTVPEIDLQQMFQYLVNRDVFDLEEIAEYARKANG